MDKKNNLNLTLLSKYKPSNLDEIIGNKNTISLIRKWIKDFKYASLKQIQKKSKCKKKSTEVSSISYIHGPGGIGKTLLATMILQSEGYLVFEMNAGDIRSKKRIQEIMEKLLLNGAVDIMKKNNKNCSIGIIMDDIDGMSCGDKGGLHELFSAISSTNNCRIPVICISTKPYEKKIANNVMTEFELSMLTKSDLLPFFENICMREKWKLHEDKLLFLMQFCNFDVRKTILIFEVCVQSNIYDNVSFQEFTNVVLNTMKQQTSDLNLFEITNSLYNKSLNYKQLFDSYNFDTNLIPMMIHENLPSQLNKKQITNKEYNTIFLKIIYQLSLGDMLIKNIHTKSDTIKYLNDTSGLVHTHSLNHIFYNTKNKIKPISNKITFTNSLSKSATQSNMKTILSSIGCNLNCTQKYFCDMFPLINNEIIEKENIKIVSKLEQTEIEKIIQIYQKWGGDKLSIKEKKKIKKLFD